MCKTCPLMKPGLLIESFVDDSEMVIYDVGISRKKNYFESISVFSDGMDFVCAMQMCDFTLS